MTEAVAIALTTLPSRDEADRLAADAVAAGLAACAQVDGPIRSHYVWEGKVENEDEFRVTFKFAVALSPVWLTTKRVLPEAKGVSMPVCQRARLAFSKVTFACAVTSLVSPCPSVSVTMTRWLVASG